MLENVKRKDPFSEKGKDAVLKGDLFGDQKDQRDKGQGERLVKGETVPKGKKKEKERGKEKQAVG